MRIGRELPKLNKRCDFMMYDRNKGVKSILNARKNGDRIERHCETCALFNTVNGKITHNLPSEARYGHKNWLYFFSDTYPLYENNNYVGYYLEHEWFEPDKEDSKP